MVTKDPRLDFPFFGVLAIKRDDHGLGCRMESVMRGAKIQLPLTTMSSNSSSSSQGKGRYDRTRSFQQNQST